jgi:hypothetical protein
MKTTISSYGMGIEIIRTAIRRDTLKHIAAARFGDFVKTVVDVINVRPSDGNRSRDVEKPDVRAKILAIVRKLVEE